MPSRPASPSLLRHHVEAYSTPATYNGHVAHDSQALDTQSPMGRSHNSLDIVLASGPLILRGTGIDVEPCILRGNVVLNLAEATTFKEITMQFKGKSRVPQVQNDGSSIIGGGYQTNLLYHHHWSFLEGELTHSPTLKAGRHAFPFQLQLDGYLPSSLSTHAGESAIAYKLRAIAVRPGFASNLHATSPVRILRSFTPEALEYQQTLELENTWPDKMMYSLMVPHKAWAAGDTIKTLAKFCPLVKGVRVASITTSVQEHVKTFPKIGPSHDTTRVIATANHEIRNGQAVTTQANDPTRGVATYSRPTPPMTAPNSPALSVVHPPIIDCMLPVDPCNGTSLVRPLLTGGSETGILGLSMGDGEQHRFPEDNLDIGEEEVITTLPIYLPTYSTPSHSVEPIIVTHRIRWTVAMTNLDGHISELRCSLPLHILDYTLLEDARLATRATRRLLFGVDDAQPHALEELELPSYPAHILDRIANAYPHPSPMPSSNPSATRPDESPALSHAGPVSESTPRTSISHVGPREAPTTRSESPGAVALDWVNSELHRISRAWQRPTISVTTPPDSRQGSRHASRASSRAASPERGSGNGRERPHHHHHHSIFSLKPFAKVASSLQGKTHAPAAADGTVHTQGSMLLSPESSAADSASTGSGSGSGSPSPVLPGRRSVELHAPVLVDSTFSEVPDYDVASRGFLGGGVTPLSSTRGLPSYEEAERSGSDGDIPGRFAAVRSST